MMHAKVTKILIVVVTLLVPFLMLPETQAKTEMAWKWEVSSPDWIKNVDLLATCGGSATDVYAAGMKSTLLYYGRGRGEDAKTDLSWQPILNFEEDRKIKNLTFHGVWGSTEKNVFVVGEQGSVLFGFKGVHWSTMQTPVNEKGNKENLYGIWGSSWEDVFAVGSNGTILHYDGDGNGDGTHDDIWEVMISGNTATLNGIWGSSSDNVYAVGNSGIILHYDGKEWSPVNNLPITGAIPDFKAVWGSSWKDVFVVGSNGIILHYDGDGNNDEIQDDIWEAMKSGTDNLLRGVGGNSPNNVFAVGEGNTVLKYDGEEWGPVKNFPDLGKKQIFTAVWLTPNPHNVFIMGGNGKIVYGAQYQGNCYIGGCIYDLHDGAPIIGAQVHEKVSGVWHHRGTTYQPPTGGEVRFDDVPCTVCDSTTLQFSASSGGYKTEERIVDLAMNAVVPINNFLFKPSQVYNIAGVISKICGGYDCPLNGVRVNLNREIANYEFSFYRPAYTDSKGRYSFTSLPPGLYEIEPVESGCQFGKLYANISPNSPAIAYNFTGTSIGSGMCMCDINCP